MTTNNTTDKKARTERLCRNGFRAAAICFALAAGAIVAASVFTHSFGRHAGQIILLLGLCGMSVVLAKSTGKKFRQDERI